ncbi:hypothetical protein Tco_1265256 [Tanacetum coccineum]
MDESWQSWYKRTNSGKLVRQASTAVGILNEMVFGLSDQVVDNLKRMFRHNISGWDVSSKRDLRSQLIDCIGSISIPRNMESTIRTIQCCSWRYYCNVHFFYDNAMLHQERHLGNEWFLVISDQVVDNLKRMFRHNISGWDVSSKRDLRSQLIDYTLDAENDGIDENRLLPTMYKIWPFLIACIRNGKPLIAPPPPDSNNPLTTPDAMVDYAKLTDPEKEAYTGDKEVGQKKPFSDYHVISDVKSFVKFIKKIPDDNKAKLAESPFTHFLNLENEKLQLDYVCVTLSQCFDDKMNLQLDSKGSGKEVLEVTKDHFWALMRIVEMDPIDPNSVSMNIDERLKEKFCTQNNKDKFQDISMLKVKAILREVNEGVDDINRAFALLAMHSIVFPPKRSLFNHNMLRYVNDVNAKRIKIGHLWLYHLSQEASMMGNRRRGI